ncbi:MAG: hypothetical protein ACP5GY_08945 [Vulcanisaeta sp.]
MEIPQAVSVIISMLKQLGFRVFLIGARALAFYGIVKETGDWHLTINRPFSVEIRDLITNKLRDLGYNVQWRKWGFMSI